MKTLQALVLVCAALAVATANREKRQIGGTMGVGGKSIGGGMGHGFGQYDYNDYYGDYVGDYNYDYYDWVCTTNPPNCQLCNILGSECCDPANDVNCFLPDTCLNNPCLAGGTCITTKTIDDRPDFTCVCLPGLSGKYCQLATDYFVGAQFFAPPPAPVMPVFEQPLPQPMPAGQYQAPAQQYQAAPAAPAQQYQAAPAAPAQPGYSQRGKPPGGSIPYDHPALKTHQSLGSQPLVGHQIQRS